MFPIESTPEGFRAGDRLSRDEIHERGVDVRTETYDGTVTVHGDTGITDLPGSDLVLQGIDDLHHGRDTVAAALARMAAPRLRSVGVEVPRAGDGPAAGHRLYELLSESDAASAHSRYNALVARMVSFARAAERAQPG